MTSKDTDIFFSICHHFFSERKSQNCFFNEIFRFINSLIWKTSKYLANIYVSSGDFNGKFGQHKFSCKNQEVFTYLIYNNNKDNCANTKYGFNTYTLLQVSNDNNHYSAQRKTQKSSENKRHTAETSTLH